MPSPYAEQGDVGKQRALNALSTYGSNGAAPNVPIVAQNQNGIDVTLTGAFQALATLSGIIGGPGTRVVATASVSAIPPGGPSTDAQLHIQIDLDGTPLNAQDIIQSMDLSGDGCTATYTIVFAPPVNVLHTLTVKAKGTGDGTLQVKAGMGTLVAVTYG
jgi:hypothetical protein